MNTIFLLSSLAFSAESPAQSSPTTNTRLTSSAAWYPSGPRGSFSSVHNPLKLGFGSDDEDFWMAPPPQLSGSQQTIHTVSLASNAACLGIAAGVVLGEVLTADSEGGTTLWAFGSLP